jgi:hypothetical protein
MKESEIQDQIRLILGSDPAGVWWRNSVGSIQVGARIAWIPGRAAHADCWPEKAMAQ